MERFSKILDRLSHFVTREVKISRISQENDGLYAVTFENVDNPIIVSTVYMEEEDIKGFKVGGKVEITKAGKIIKKLSS